jgi:hypothetical protein
MRQMADSDYTLIKFEGGRFEDMPGIPADVLGEVVRFNTLLVSVARSIWLDRNGRKRVPKGFNESLQLRLTEVRRGSVMPVLLPGLEDGSNGQLPGTDPEFQGLLMDAQTEIGGAIDALHEGDDLPPTFPEISLKDLEQLGRSLDPGEACRVLRRGGTFSSKYDRRSRQRLAQKISAGSEVNIEGSLVGRIGKVDPNRLVFEFFDRSGVKVDGKFSESDHFEDLKEGSQAWADAPFVRLKCQFVANIHDELQRIDDVAEVETVIGKDDNLGDSLWHLMELPAGWLDGDGQEISENAIELARDFAAQLEVAEMAGLDAGPTAEGGVVLDQEHTERRWLMEIDAEGGVHVVTIDGSVDTASPAQTVSEAVESYRGFLD